MFKINKRHKGIEYKNKCIDNIGYKRIAIIMLNEFWIEKKICKWDMFFPWVY